jgi:hypothetical protein
VSSCGTSFPPIVSIRYNKLQNSKAVIFFIAISRDVCIECGKERGSVHGDREKSAIIDSPQKTCAVSPAKRSSAIRMAHCTFL